MSLRKHGLIIGTIAMQLLMSGCQRTTAALWEDTKTIARYINQKGKQLLNKESDSRLILSDDEFLGPLADEFVPLKNEDLKVQYTDDVIAPPAELPALKESAIPGITAFRSPEGALANVFQTLNFETDDHVLRKKQQYVVVGKIANFLKKHPNTLLFVEGHCDERASESYNLALGTRRANAIRSLLVKRGVNANQVYTISYGKAQPVSLERGPAAWAKNRRAEFKIYDN